MTKIFAKLYKLSEPQCINLEFMHMVLSEVYGSNLEIRVSEMNRNEKLEASHILDYSLSDPIRAITNHIILYKIDLNGDTKRLHDLEIRIEKERVN
jgi:hypothetical protein